MADDVKVLPSSTVESTLDTLMAEDEPEKGDVLKLDEKEVEKPLKDEEVDEVLKLDGEEEDEEEKEKEVTEETDELVVPPKRQEILKAYPEIFKKFPFLERMMYRDREFGELGLSSPDDAKELIEKVDNFSKFETDLFDGDPKSILLAVKAQDQQAYAKIVDNFLPALYAADPSACAHLVNNLHRQNIKEMMLEAKKSGNEDLQTAASLYHQWVFGNTDWKEPTNFSKPSPEKDDVSKEREELSRQRFETAYNDVTERFDNALKTTITQNIDPNDTMTSYVKKNAINDALRDMNKILANDKSFKAILDKKWQQAAKSNFSKDSMNSIKSTLLARAKPDLLNVIRKARTEALKGAPVRDKKNSDDGEKKGHLPVGRTASNSGGNSGNKGEIPRGMSTKDYFLQD